MAPDKRDAIQRWATVLALIGSLLGVEAWARNTNDDRYVRRTQYEQDIGQMKGDMRVLRCKVAHDC